MSPPKVSPEAVPGLWEDGERGWSPYLAVQQLGLRAPRALDLIADAVEQSDSKLLLVAPAELAQHLPRLLCNTTAEPRQARAGFGV